MKMNEERMKKMSNYKEDFINSQKKKSLKWDKQISIVI